MDPLKTTSLSARAQEAIMQLIEGMDLAQDNKLPREELLASQLGVSRTTIRQALNNLAAEGVVSRRQGKGTFVNVDSIGIRVTFSPCMELMQAIRNSGFEPSVRLLSAHAADEGSGFSFGRYSMDDVRRMLELEAGDRLIEHDKVFFADGEPCAFCRDYFGASVAGGEAGLDDLERYDDSLCRFVYNRSGRRVEWDKVEIDVAAPDDLSAVFASQVAPGAGRPFLCIRSVNYDQNSRPVVCAVEYVDTSVIRYNLIRQKAVDYQRQ